MSKEILAKIMKQLQFLIERPLNCSDISKKVNQIFADNLGSHTQDFLEDVIEEAESPKSAWFGPRGGWFRIMDLAIGKGTLEIIMAISDIYLRHNFFSYSACKNISKTLKISNPILHREVNTGFPLENKLLNLRDFQGNNLLHSAISCKQTHIIDWLIENGTDVNSVNLEKDTALSFASLADIHGTFPFLLNKLYNKVNLNSQNHYGYTILHNIIHEDNLELVRKFLNLGINIDINCQDFFGSNSLTFAAFNGHLEIVKILLKYSREKNIRLTNIAQAIRVAEDSQVKKANLKKMEIIEILRKTLKFYEVEDALLAEDASLIESPNPVPCLSSSSINIFKS